MSDSGDEFIPDPEDNFEYSDIEEELEEVDSEVSAEDTEAAWGPHRFEGSRHLYLKYTRNEKLLKDSLDKLANDDLSAHLYNTHALRRRVRKADTQECTDFGRKQRWCENPQTWAPPRLWAAWPLQPGQAPRLEDLDGAASWDNGDALPNTRVLKNVKPSSDLEDIILSIILNKAKERFKKRRFNEDESGFKRSKKAKLTVESETATGKESNSHGRHPNHKDSADMLKAPSETDTKDAEMLRPVILTDDNRARRIAGPAIQHLISKIEKLLLTLHKSRRSFLRRDSGAPVESEDDQFEESGDDLGKDGNVFQGFKTLNLRDWSEVVGIAALVGWKPDLLDRVKRRCENVIGESMQVETFDEQSCSAKYLHDDSNDKNYDEESMPTDHYLKTIAPVARSWAKYKNREF